jgi:phosphoglycerate dehydrogenase-like enzyme
VVVCHVPSYASNAVAELALGLMLAVLRKIPAADRDLRRSGRPDWQPFQGSELHGKTLGVVGTGVIGQRVARLGHCLDMRLLGYDVRPAQTMSDDLGMRYTPLSELFAGSDVVTLHAPLTPATEGLVDGALLRRLPETAIVINTARAGLIRQDDLLEALSAKTIAGAGLDVIDLGRESGPKLLALDNVVSTPHIGFYTREALAKLTAVCVDNVVRFLDGRPANVAAPPEENDGI